MTHEYVGDLHAHSCYSDGFARHDEMAEAAIRAGLDFIVVTDHNVLVRGVEGYRYLGDRRVLLLTGEEIHDQNRDPQKNHLLVFEVPDELAPLASRPQRLIDAVNRAEGLAFIAHPIDPEAARFSQPDLSWVDWGIEGYVGIEIWNFMSEFKSLLASVPAAIFYAYHPDRVGHSPLRETLSLWDGLLNSGQQVVAVGGTDAHGLRLSLGPLKRTVFPYDFAYSTVRTHVLLDEPLTGEPDSDRKRLFHSLRHGWCFVGYDLPASTNGFRFTAHGNEGTARMGDSLRLGFGATLQVKLPQKAQVRLVRNGETARSWTQVETALLTVSQSGAYRVEAYLHYKGKPRGWIYSNPIYLIE